jgi:polysaccharide export outer membrane protein
MITSRNRLLCAVFVVLPFAVGALGQAALAPGHVAAPAASGDAVASALHDSYLIGNDDLLGINVWKEPDFTQSIPVRSDGQISLPLIGEISAAGRTPLQLEQDIASKLRSYLTNPEVTVMVLQMNSRKFNVLGRVAKPGSYPLTATTTVLDAIAEAGGIVDFAKQKNIYILRKSPRADQTRIAFNYRDVIRGIHPEQNIRIEPHDTIVVP